MYRTRHTRAAAAVLTVAALAVALAACSGSHHPDAGGTTPTGKPKAGGTLRVLDFLAVDCLAPEASGAYPDSVVTNQLYDRLTYEDAKTAKISACADHRSSKSKRNCSLFTALPPTVSGPPSSSAAMTRRACSRKAGVVP